MAAAESLPGEPSESPAGLALKDALAAWGPPRMTVLAVSVEHDDAYGDRFVRRLADVARSPGISF